MLVATQQPLILANRTIRTQQGVDMLVELAESLGAPAVGLGSRIKSPQHPQPGL